MTHFEHNLPILRRRAGYTQENLAEALGVPVFDTISAANLLAYAVRPPRYL